MIEPYSQKYILNGVYGNNVFSYEKREQLHETPPHIIIPSRIQGTIADVIIGDEIVFEEMDNNLLRSCVGLKHFVSLSQNTSKKLPPITIFDNHNHALYFWIEALRDGIINPGCELIHIDEHSDLWDNPHTLDLDKAINDPIYTWEFTNYSCNVGNYIIPALRSWLISTMIRIENAHEVDEYIHYIPHKNSILNLDLDIFAPELDFIPEQNKITLIKNLIPQVRYVTIATSPFFIDPWIALKQLNTIFASSENP